MLVKALAAFKELTEKFGGSKFVSDAKAQIQQITRREVGIDTNGQQRPGQAAKINVNSRNVKSVKFTAYKVKLEEVLAKQENLNKTQTQFTAWGQNFGNITNARQYFGEKAASDVQPACPKTGECVHDKACPHGKDCPKGEKCPHGATCPKGKERSSSRRRRDRHCHQSHHPLHLQYKTVCRKYCFLKSSGR